MKTCHAAALALVGWYLTAVPAATNAQASLRLRAINMASSGSRYRRNTNGY